MLCVRRGGVENGVAGRRSAAGRLRARRVVGHGQPDAGQVLLSSSLVSGAVPPVLCCAWK